MYAGSIPARASIDLEINTRYMTQLSISTPEQIHSSGSQVINPISRKVIDNPNIADHQLAFLQHLQEHIIDEETDNISHVKKAIEICLVKPYIHSQLLFQTWLSFLNLDTRFIELLTMVRNKNLSIQGNEISILNDSFFLTGLKHLSMAHVECELMFTTLRSHFLYADHENLESFLPFLCALARQCDLNEYIYTYAAEEYDKAQELEQSLDLSTPLNTATMAKIALLGCYQPLKKTTHEDEISAQTKSSNNQDFIELIKIQIDEPRALEKQYDEISTFSPIDNQTSLSVAQQYEENPYPRWHHVEIPSISAAQQDPAKDKNILVAGCGTGQELIGMALHYPKARFLGIDISKASLAYAQKKTAELGLSNIEFMHMDLLDLEKLNKTFDMITCCGVLHHMQDPMQGWHSLLSCLKPEGILKIALYSEHARQAVVLCREWIEKKGYTPTAGNIRQFRQDIIKLEDQNPMKNIVRTIDFYSMSMCRDLVFHVQEHRFTLPQIKNALDDLALDLIQFKMGTPDTLQDYQALYPNDPNTMNLDQLDEYEKQNPDIFRGMYTFWCQRKSALAPNEMPDWFVQGT